MAAPAEGDPAPPAPVIEAESASRAVRPEPIRRAAAELVARVEKLGGRAGVSVVDVSTGEVLAAVHEHLPLNPASNAKLVTAALALHALGGERRLLTGLYGTALGADVGELVLRGEGDPSLGSADLRAMARELAESGVRSVGSVVVDQSAFDDKHVPPAFEQQPDEWAPFRAPVAAVSLNENTVTFVVRPGERGRPAAVTVEPPGFVELTGSVRTGAKKTPEKVTLTLEPRGRKLGARLDGQVPEGGRVVQLARRVDDPSLLAGHALVAALKDAGIAVRGEVRLGLLKKGSRLLATHRSAPLSELLSELGKSSDNFYAEMLFKHLGADPEGNPASDEAAAARATRYLSEIGALEAGVVVRNGSGLFDANRMTASAMTSLLRASLRDSSVGPELVAELAIGGVDGTLRGRFRAWRSRRAVRAKTGTLAAVAALSGYLLPPGGRPTLAFSILVNDVPGKITEARSAIDDVIDATCAELWKNTEAPGAVGGPG